MLETLPGFCEKNTPHENKKERHGLVSINYSYAGNQLLKITGGDTCKYDKNGNMKFDGLRGFKLSYNILNLPATIRKGNDSLSYIYSASGEKLAKSYNGTIKQYYTGNMVYNTAKNLDYILDEEGMVTKASAYI